MTAIIETENLTKVFGHTRVVDSVNMQLPQGAIYGLVGPNGAGKSTLLKMLIGFCWPSSGKVQILGQMLTKEAANLRQRVHLVTSEWDAFKTFRIHDLIKYYSLLYHQFDESRSVGLLKVLELPQRTRVQNLSLGMKAQLRLALALATHPDILLLDEPTNGLDPIVKRQFLQLLVQESAVDGTTILLATHHLDDLDRIADGVAVMHGGRLITMSALDELKEKVKEIQFVLPGELPRDVRNQFELVSYHQKGQFHTLVVEEPSEAVIEALQAAGALHIQMVDLPFDELFRRLMDKEGYTRDSLLL